MTQQDEAERLTQTKPDGRFAGIGHLDGDDVNRKEPNAGTDDASKPVPSPTLSTSPQRRNDIHMMTSQKLNDIHILATGIFHSEKREETDVDFSNGNCFEMTSLNLQREVLTMSIRSEHCRISNGCSMMKQGCGSNHDQNKEKTMLTYNWIRGSKTSRPQKFEEFFFKCEVEHLV